MLRAMTIENFKCFERLELADLGQFNLLTGRNNVGKSSVLEAMQLTSEPTPIIESLIGIIIWRSLKISPYSFSYFYHYFRDGNDIVFKLKREFVIQKEKFIQDSEFKLKKIDKEDLLYIFQNPNLEKPVKENFLSIFNLEKPPNGFFSIVKHMRSNLDKAINIESLLWLQAEKEKSYNLSQIVCIEGNEVSSIMGRNSFMVRLGRGLLEKPELGLNAILTTLSNKTLLLKALTDFTSLNIVDCQLIGDSELMLAVDSYGDRMVPIGILGDGAISFVTLMVCILKYKNGVLFIDEIDDGLHYSSMVKVWQHAMKLAQEHNVQLFATTHSMECVRAFSEVANEKSYDARLININKPYARHHEALISNAQELAELLEDGVELT
jgi:energy-coupling factor transporter ATP-binding protein EcfA2